MRGGDAGPWQVNRFDNDGGEINWQVQQVPRPSEVIANVTDDEPKRARYDAALIASARTDLPRLAADLRAERARRADAEMRLAELRAEIEAMETRLRASRP